MIKTITQRRILSVAAMTSALLISSSTAMVFAAETATIEQDVAVQMPAAPDKSTTIGRFVITPTTSSFVATAR